MDFFIILIVLFVIFSNINKGKKQKQAQEEARRRAMEGQQSGMPQQPLPTRQPSVDMRFPPASGEGMPTEGRHAPAQDPRFPDYAPPPQRPQPPPMVQPVKPPQVRQQPQQQPPQQQQRTAPLQPRMQQPLAEGVGTQLQSTQTTTLQTPMGRRHTLEASSITGHAHTESSMGGGSDCPPVQPISVLVHKVENGGLAESLRNPESLKLAILYSEILGKPKALRRV